MPVTQQDIDELNARTARARSLKSESGQLASDATTFKDDVMNEVRKARAQRGVDVLSQDMGTVSGQIVTENPAIRERMADVNPLTVDQMTTANRGQLLNTLTTLGNYQEQNTGTVTDIVNAGSNQILAAAKNKEAEADKARAEAQDLMSSFEMKLKQEQADLERRKFEAEQAKKTAGSAFLQALNNIVARKQTTGKQVSSSGTVAGTQTQAQPVKQDQRNIAQKATDWLIPKTKAAATGAFNTGGMALDLYFYNKAKSAAKMTDKQVLSIAQQGTSSQAYKKLNDKQKEAVNVFLSYNQKRQSANEAFKQFGFDANAESGQQFNPVKFAKGTVGGATELASFMAPEVKGVTGAKKIAQAAKIGTVIGGGQGFSNSGEGVANTVGGTVTGIGTGGATGAALQGLSNLLGMRKTAGKALQDSITNPKVSTSPFMADTAEELAKARVRLGLKGSAEEQIKQAPKIFKSLTEDIATTLSKNTKTIKTTDAMQTIADALDNNINFDYNDPAYKKAFDKFTNQFTKVANKEGKDGLSLTAKDVFTFKQNLGAQLSNAFKKLERGTPLTSSEEVALTFWKKTDDVISSLVPEVTQKTRDQSMLYKLMPGLVSKSKETVTIPFAGTKVKTGAVQSATDKLGAFLQRGGETSQAANKLSELVQMGNRTVGAETERGLAGGVSSMITATPQAPTNPATQLNTMFGVGNNPYGLTDEEKALVIQAGINSGEIKDIKGLQEAQAYLESGAQGKMTEKQKMYNVAAQNAQYAFQLLESGQVKTGLGQDILGKIGAKVPGMSTPQQTSYRSTIATIRTMLKNALLGASMSQQEMESLAPSIPEFNDPPEVARQKLIDFMRITGQLSSGNVLPSVIGNVQ